RHPRDQSLPGRARRASTDRPWPVASSCLPHATDHALRESLMAAIDDVEQFADDRLSGSPRREPEGNKLFRALIEVEGSDLNLQVGLAPMMRLKGEIQKMNAPPLSQEDMERLLLPIMSERMRRILEETGGADFAHVVGQDECRFRVNLFK